jgi:hypothetical protein
MPGPLPPRLPDPDDASEDHAVPEVHEVEDREAARDTDEHEVGDADIVATAVHLRPAGAADKSAISAPLPARSDPDRSLALGASPTAMQATPPSASTTSSAPARLTFHEAWKEPPPPARTRKLSPRARLGLVLGGAVLVFALVGSRPCG